MIVLLVNLIKGGIVNVSFVFPVTVFQDKSYYCMYKMIGWGIPLLMTALWAVVTAYYMREERCWWGYNLTAFFWILEGPRLAAVSVSI